MRGEPGELLKWIESWTTGDKFLKTNTSERQEESKGMN
jgi:hypothetical protein